MILTKSSGYWSTGITLRYRDAYGNRPESWSGSLDFHDDGFLNDNPTTGVVSTEGTLRTRYFVEGRPAEVALAAVINTLIADASRLGIHFENSVSKPALYYAGDGNDEEFPPPEGWRHMLRMQADRIGWDSYRVDVEAS